MPASRSASIDFTRSTAIAAFWFWLAARPEEKVLTPITSPNSLNSGPPELPPFSGAWCWMTSGSEGEARPSEVLPVGALTMPSEACRVRSLMRSSNADG